MNNNLEKCPFSSNEIHQQYCNLDRSLCLEVSNPQLLFAALERISNERDQQNYRASHDALTGLWNKTAWEELAAEKIIDAEETGKKLGLVFIDLTNFKKVNDELGHTTGDSLLKDFGELLKDFGEMITPTLRDSDIGRAGGDEFVVLCDLSSYRDSTTKPLERLNGATNRLRQEIDIFFENRYEFSNLGATAAAGSCLWTPNMSLAELITHADNDMRSVKKIQHEQCGKYRA